MLRNRLKDLEDDNKSSVVGGGSMASPRSSAGGGEGESALVVGLRKDLAKVEHEKANLEREFMNQMSSLAGENRALISDLREKLARSEALNDELTGRLSKRVGLDEDGEHRLLHLERERHAKEMEQLTATLASSDEEIAENRRDMDHLQAQVDDLLAEKEDLERQLGEVEGLYEDEKQINQDLREQLAMSDSTKAKLELELQQKDKQIEKHLQEVGHLNDTCIQLQNHKDMLLAEVTDLKLEWNKQGSSKKLPRSSPPSLPTLADPDSKLEDVRLLENRVARFQEKLGERDRTIDNLADSLNEERRASKALKAEIKLLKQQNANLEAAKKDVAPRTPPMSPPSLTRVASHGALESQPRTPVSGIVASFEKRLNTSAAPKSPEKTSEATGKVPLVRTHSLDRRAVPTSSNSSVATMNTEDDAVQLLRLQLEKERSVVTELQSKLSHERLLVRQLQQEIQTSKADLDAVGALRDQLTEKEQVVARLANKIKDDSAAILDLEAKLRLEQEVSRKLRADLDESPRKEMKASMGLNQLLEQEQNLVKDLRKELAESAVRSDADKATVAELREKLQQEQEVVKGLRAELASALLNGGGDLVAKLNESQREIDRLRSKIQGYEAEKLGFVEKSRKSQSELSKLRMKAHQAHTEKKELKTKVTVASREVERLRGELSYQLDVGSVTGSMQGSVQDEKKEEYDDDESVRLRDQVSDLNSELSAAYKEIEKLQLEVDRLKKELMMETAAAEELRKKTAEEPIGKQAQKAYEARFNQLQVELTRVQVAKAEMEQGYTNRLHELENELEAMEVEAEQEIETRDAELEELQNKLGQQEALVARLQAEHAQFCHSMNDVSTSKQDDIDELQAELMAMTSKTSAQARELQSLKMKLEEHETRKKDVAKKYEARIRDLEHEIASVKEQANDGLDKAEAESIKSENSRLRDAIRDVQMERRALKDRLDSVMSDKTSSRSAQVLRDRNVALKEEVEKLTKRLKKMEASITRFAI
jgi:intracellular protein transport protein USO1